MYPLIFRPIVKEMIWGNESWEVTCRPQEMSVVENGEFAGRELSDFYEGTRFPLLVKIITARDALSVQVHPDDAYARTKGGADTGKSELWYILKPPEDGFLVVGLKPGVTRDVLARAYRENTVEECLGRVRVSCGDFIKIPAGLIHALTPGTIVAEIQQNSDITYRLYDFGRMGADGKPRELHVEDALNAIDYNNAHGKEIEHFSMEKIEITAPLHVAANPEKFTIYTCVDGGVVFEGAAFSVPLHYPRSAFIHQSVDAFKIRPTGESATVLKSRPR